MANNQIGTEPGFAVVDKRRTTAASQASSTPLSNGATYDSISALRTRLGVINGAYFTATMLDNMTVNDMQYACRLNDDVLGA
jgi:hypothetical protein